MGTNCCPLVADLLKLCYERKFMKAVSLENQKDITEAFNITSGHLDDLLNIDNIHFEQTVDRIYHAGHSSDTGALFLDLNSSISNGTVSTI